MTEFEIFGLGVVMGAIGLTILLGIGAWIDDGLVKRKYDGDSDVRVYVPSRDRDRSGDNGLDKSMGKSERIIGVLNTIKIGSSRSEKEAIEYAIASIAVRDKVEAWLDDMDSKINHVDKK